jgi:hypothetical protein
VASTVWDNQRFMMDLDVWLFHEVGMHPSGDDRAGGVTCSRFTTHMRSAMRLRLIRAREGTARPIAGWGGLAPPS